MHGPFTTYKKMSWSVRLHDIGFNPSIVLLPTKLSEYLNATYSLLDEIFTPLNMNDTHFYLPEEKNSRLVKVQTKEKEDWVSFSHKRYNVNYPIEGAKKFYSGGAGLSSTAEDYFKFLIKLN